jgi:hypothetical protein
MSMRQAILAAGLMAGLAATGVQAQSGPAAGPEAAVPMVQRTEKLKLQGKRGESLLRPG